MAARAVEITLAHAVRQGIPRAVLAGCAFDPAHCGPPNTGLERPANDGAWCIVEIHSMSDFFQIKVWPRAVDGAPRWIDAAVDANATDPPGRFYVGASTWALGRRQHIIAAGVDGRTSHTHGGDSAHVDETSIYVRNDTTTPLRVRARRLEWMTSGSCEVPTEVRARPHVTGISLEDSYTPVPEVAIAPGTAVTIRVSFDPQPAYYTYCDRFAARVTLDVGGESLAPIVETQVSRREPSRRTAP
jgi:hypothetical protein